VSHPSAVDDRQSRSLEHVLSRYWGYTSFRPLQREAMDAILEGRDSVVVLPTGGGKSLCFQAPALAGHPRGGPALVVSPLISLMKDQVDTLVENGVEAACYNSALGADQKAAVAAGIRQRRYSLLYVPPERLAGEGSDSFLQMLGPISYLAIDEAHCISQWGHDFRPEYRQLGALRHRFPGVSLHAFTATATGRVRRDIAAQLQLRQPLELVGSFDRPNLIYRVLPRASLKRQLEEILSRHRGEAGIIYCTSRRAWTRWPNGWPRTASAPSRITPGWTTASGTGTRMRFSTSTPTSWWRPSPSAWASIAPTCVSSSTPARRSRWSTTSRNRDAPGATGSRPSACWSIPAPTS